MNYGLETGSHAAVLRGAEGNLVFVRVRAHERLLEDVLEALACASFPINPEIRHGHPYTTVEFPAYDTNVAEVRHLMQSAGIRDAEVELTELAISW